MRAFSLALLLLTAPFASGDEKPFYLTLKTPPAPELSPDEARASFSLAPGFDIELVASEPLVEDPVAIAWDEAGDLYTVEMRGFMPDAYGTDDTDPVGSVVRLRDLDGDGKFDQREVLLDQLVLPRAIAIVNEGLLIGEPPNLWLCPSHSGSSKDINCQEKIRLSNYADEPGNVEHGENGLLLAIDNWIYNAKSSRRMQIRNGKLVDEPTLFRGQWGISQDNQGLLYYNTNSNFLLGDVYDAQPVIAAGNAGGAGLNIQVSKKDQVFAVRVNPGVNRAYVPGVLREDGRLNNPTSASGMVYYRGDQFPSAYNQDVFVAEPAGNVVVQLRLKHEGLQVSTDHILYEDEKWGQREFLASTDERFRPVDVDVGPDGALYVVDMYRGIIQDQIFLSDELRAQALSRGLDEPIGMGRIWRITAVEGASTAARPQFPSSGVKLLKRLEAENGWVRDTAQRLLLRKKGRGIDRGLSRLVTQDDEHAAVHAIWTLEGRGTLNRPTLLKALANDNTSIQLAAIKAGHKLLSAEELLEMATQSSDSSIVHHATMYLAASNHRDDVIEYLASSLVKNDTDGMRRIAIQAASRSNELTLIDAIIEKGWGKAEEQSAGFVRDLTSQSFRATPKDGDVLLDHVLQQDQRWMQEAMLTGLFEVTRDESFSRVVLAEPHIMFTNPPEGLWPAISKVRRAFTWEGDDLTAGAKPLSPEQQRRKNKGEDYYRSRCGICHGSDGKGISSTAPTLAESEWVTGPSEWLARIVLHGLQGPISVRGEAWNSVMPGHIGIEEFDDETASGLLTFLHRAWGHSGRAIEPAFIHQIRKETTDRVSLWTAAELAELEINTHYRRYTGTYGGGPFTLKFSYDGRNLMVQSVFFNGLMREDKEDHFFFEPRDFKVEFVRGDDGKVNAVRVAVQGGIELPRISD
ncbi:MAG: cytochrome c, class I [Gammaproteobacteria bacterium]|nr:cytochrome c, class I [Gammaproteobacteria bacterium]